MLISSSCYVLLEVLTRATTYGKECAFKIDCQMHMSFFVYYLRIVNNFAKFRVR
jgi:hypothetical protein